MTNVYCMNWRIKIVCKFKFMFPEQKHCWICDPRITTLFCKHEFENNFWKVDSIYNNKNGLHKNITVMKSAKNLLETEILRSGLLPLWFTTAFSHRVIIPKSKSVDKNCENEASKWYKLQKLATFWHSLFLMFLDNF